MELGRGLFEGVTGVVMAPVRGAEREGVVGFGKGLVKGKLIKAQSTLGNGCGVTVPDVCCFIGLVGMAVKPAVGMFDFASKATEGIKNFTRADILSQVRDTLGACSCLIGMDQHDQMTLVPWNVGQHVVTGSRGRVRPPRPFGANGELKEYNVQDAVAQQVLHSVLNGRFAREQVIFQIKMTAWVPGLNQVELDEADFLRVFKQDLAETISDTMVSDPTNRYL